MRVTKAKDGTYRVEDEPVRLAGKAADRFLDKMAERERTPDPDKKRFLDASREVYEKARAKLDV